MSNCNVAATQPPLLQPPLPEGFRYRAELVTSEYEHELSEAIEKIEFAPFVMRGVEARRRVAFFGSTYGPRYGRAEAPPLPEFLLELRETVAAWSGIPAPAFAMVLINEYRPGSPIGWHRDAPQYDVVAGVSLLSSCRMRFRPYLRPGRGAVTPAPRRTATHEVLLERRSVYLLTGASRSAFEHQIPPVEALRYSVTFRTLRI
jgi:alkylated DNA repair dioxygenase AlkB